MFRATFVALGSVRSIVRAGLIFMFGSLPFSAVPEENALNCAPYFPDDRTVSFFIKMRLEDKLIPFRVHESYLEDRWKRVEGAEHEAMLFSVRLDNFVPVTRAETPNLRSNGIEQYFTFLLGDRVPLQKLAALRLSAASPLMSITVDELDDIPRIERDHSLLELTPLRAEERQKDVYVTQTENAEITSVTACNAPGVAPFPGCSTYFRSDTNVDVKMNFQLGELPNWQSLKSSVEEFLTCSSTF